MTAWNDSMHLGIPLYGLHWLVLAVDPVDAFMALFPASEIFRLGGYITAVNVAIGALAAYALLRDFIRSPFPAAVGAVLYACGAWGTGSDRSTRSTTC